jgi:hypothetical protein
LTIPGDSLPRALFMYLDDEHALPFGSLALSRREVVRQAYEEMLPEKKHYFQRELCRRIGDSSRAIGERTRLIDIVAVVNPDRYTRRLVRRQILDDVRELFRAPIAPTGAAGIEYVRRLRCLLEIGTVESAHFWTLAYQLCGSSCSLVVFTAIHARQSETALDWLATYLSAWEQVRILEKVMPAIRQRGGSDLVESAELVLQAARTAGPAGEVKGREWRDILQSFLNGSLNMELNRTGLMEYLRDTASRNVLPQIEKQESHLRIAVDRLFEEWASWRLKPDDPRSTLRLLTLTREFQSLRVLSSLVLHLEFLDRLATTPGETFASSSQAIEIAILDCLPWFDAVIDNLARSSEDGSSALNPDLFTRIIAVLRSLRTKPNLSDRADRELVRHSPTKEDRARALVSMISKTEDPTDWIEDLDRRMPGDFQGLVNLALQQSRLQAHLKGRLAILAKWCDDAYTTRDRLFAGSGWIAEPYASKVLQVIAEARECEEFGDLVDGVEAGAWQAAE